MGTLLPSPSREIIRCSSVQTASSLGRLVDGDIVDLGLSPCGEEWRELLPKETTNGARTIVVGRIRNSIGTSSSAIEDGTCPVTTDADVEND